MTRGLLSWWEDPSTTTGIRFADDASGWEHLPYTDISTHARSVACLLLDAGLSPSDVVCTILPSAPSFVESIIGTWLVGATICPIVPPKLFEEEDEYVGHLSRILVKAQPAAVVTEGQFSQVVKRACAMAEIDGKVVEIVECDGNFERSPLPEIALLQFTSGSTGNPRGVRVTTENLERNIDTIIRWLHLGPGDEVATWLPMHHDMGLIGTLLMPIVSQSGVSILRPDQFVRNPGRWIDCFGRSQAVFTASPNFGYGYAASKVSRESLEGSDFSNVKAMVVGAEAINPVVLDSFALLLSDFGFKRSMIMPSYGLAEATLTVAGARIDEIPRAAKLNWSEARFGQAVEIVRFESLGHRDIDETGGWLTSSGRVHEPGSIRVVDADGNDLPDEYLGEIVVSGPWVADGYCEVDPVASTRFLHGELFTGDAGFLRQGEVFVVGRIADSLKVRGRSIYVEDLEAKITGATGIRSGRCTVISCPGGDASSVAFLVELDSRDWVDTAAAVLRSELGQHVAFFILAGPPGLIMRTSSGKPRRRDMWLAIQKGSVAAEVMFDSRQDSLRS